MAQPQADAPVSRASFARSMLRREARHCRHEPHALGSTQRARSVCLLEGRARALAHAARHGIGLLEHTLDPKDWLRIHRGSVVNVQWIKEVAPLPGGSLSLRRKDAATTELTVARDRAREFKARMAGQLASRRG